MPSSSRRQSSSKSSSKSSTKGSPKTSPKTSSKTSTRDSRSIRGSDGSYGSQSTTPTSLYQSPRPSDCKERSHGQGHGGKKLSSSHDEDLSPNTSVYPRSSADSIASITLSEDDLSMDVEENLMDYEYTNIPPLPIYTSDIVEPNVRASAPHDFAKYFPSLNRLTIRHDEFTTDGNMNLRVDTVVTGRRRTAIQLFHLRMYDLARREFSLRRYCRDSGREVCNSKRKYEEPAPPKIKSDGRPALQRSMSSAIKNLGAKPVFRRTNSASTASRPNTSYSSSDGDDEFYHDNMSHTSIDSRTGKPKSRVPTNTIKLEFSNYARVDVNRRGKKNTKRYDFEWWGHRYSWKRSIDKQLGDVSFHLVRDGNSSAPVAHIVPEARSPNQVQDEEIAGGWVPPCSMWIADPSVVDAVTDVADVIMATGLIALVDDCIKERWQTKKVHRIPVPLTSKTVGLEYVGPKAFMQQVFGRRHSGDHQGQPNTLRYTKPVSAY